jgi:hypothetical protein
MVAPAARGHQWFPAITSAGRVLRVAYYDSRVDPAYAPGRFPGNTAAGTSSGPARVVRVSRSTDGGVTWHGRRVSDVADNPDLHTSARAYLRSAFDGDYLAIDAVPGRAFAVWTDTRDVVLGSDHRAGNRVDGFDVHAPCHWVPNDIAAATYTSPRFDDPCLSQGGLDRNIYGAGTR